MQTELESGKIRPASEDDLPAILEIVAQAVPIMRAGRNPQWSEEYPNRSVFLEDIAGNTLYLYECGGETAGFICVNRVQPKEYASVNWTTEEPVAAVHRMAVSPAFRGRRIGEALLEHADRVAAENGARAIRTDTHSTNTAMNGLLQKCGYRYCGPVRLGNRLGVFHCYEKQL